MVLGLQNDYPTTNAKMFSSETVTLTKAQLKAILEAVGQVGGLRIAEEVSKPPSHIGSSSSEQDYYSIPEKLPCNQLNSSTSGDEKINGFPCDDPGAGSQFLSSSQNASVSSNNTHSLSKLQQKRRQWEQERAETECWSPWGRPGGGAPRSNKRSVVMATVSPSRSGESLKNQSRGYSGYSNLTSASFPLSTSSGQRVPDFLKSSVPFGPNCDEIDANESLEKKRQWLSDLEQQREEQRRRLDQSGDTFERDRWCFEEESEDHQHLDSPAGPHSGMNTPFSTATSQSRSYHRGQSSFDPEKTSHLLEQREKALEYRRTIQEQVEEKKRRQQEEKERLRREEELEERRLEEERGRLQAQYDLEQKQIRDKEEREEQKRLMMAAAVQRAREEAEAEKKAKLAQRFHSQTAKSPKATPTHQPNPASRLSVRDEPPHTLKSPEHSKRSAGSSTNTSPKHTGVSSKDPVQQTATVHPLQSVPTPSADAQAKVDSYDSTDLGPPNSHSVSEISCQTEQPLKLPPEPSAYVANRLLTPSVWRSREHKLATQNAWGHYRDMATQTEQVYLWETDVRASGPSSISADDRSSRNSSATSSKKGSSEKFISKSDSGTRPVWGANKPLKSFVKMTDRDPNQSRRKKFQEMRRQHWEREMASLREQLNQTSLFRSKGSNTPSRAAGHSSGTKPSTTKALDVSPKLSRARMTAESAFQARRRAASEGHSEKQSERDSAWSSAGSSIYTMSANSMGTTYTVSGSSARFPCLSRRWSHSSDHLPPTVRPPNNASCPETFETDLMVDGEQDASNFPPVRRKWHSHESFAEVMRRKSDETKSHHPSNSLAEGESISEDANLLPPPPAPPRRKWSEQGNFDPAAVALGRHLGMDSDSEKGSPDPPDRALEPDPSQDPLVNPKVVTSHPTPRQDRILQQLSTLRQGLLQKQREIETLVRHPSSWPS